MAARSRAIGNKVDIRLISCARAMESDHAGRAVEVFRSVRLPECNERAFMLFAVGIASAIARDPSGYVLLVDAGDAAGAREHLRLYEVERLNRPPPPPPPPKLYPYAWIGSLVYVLVIAGVAFAISNGLWRLDAFDVGELDAGLIRNGQWWRVWTALTLHLDGPHIAANAVAGVWFGYLASRLLGVGNAWALTLIGAGFANWIEAYLGPVTHRSVGASTAVFTALGLLSAFSWRTRLAYPQRWALRWGPLVAGIVLLSWTGAGGESLDDPGKPGGPVGGETVDVAAHVLGFAVGLGFGAAAALARVARILDRMPQWLSGLLALLLLCAGWTAALLS
jgi:rhomboid protease GluP